MAGIVNPAGPRALFNLGGPGGSGGSLQPPPGQTGDVEHHSTCKGTYHIRGQTKKCTGGCMSEFVRSKDSGRGGASGGRGDTDASGDTGASGGRGGDRDRDDRGGRGDRDDRGGRGDRDRDRDDRGDRGGRGGDRDRGGRGGDRDSGLGLVKRPVGAMMNVSALEVMGSVSKSLFSVKCAMNANTEALKDLKATVHGNMNAVDDNTDASRANTRIRALEAKRAVLHELIDDHKTSPGDKEKYEMQLREIRREILAFKS